MLDSSTVVAFVASTDLRRARLFYEQTLGLTAAGQSDFACVFDANGTMLRVTAVPAIAPAAYTVPGLVRHRHCCHGRGTRRPGGRIHPV